MLPIPNAIGSHPGSAAPQCGTCFSRHYNIVIIAALGCGDPRNNVQCLQLGITSYFVTTKQAFPLVEKAGLYSISTDKRVIPSASRRPGIWILKSSDSVEFSDGLHEKVGAVIMPALVILKSINAEYILLPYNKHIKITNKIISINTALFSPFDTFFFPSLIPSFLLFFIPGCISCFTVTDFSKIRIAIEKCFGISE
jgi:hypothetical protein